jgi:hypothetical protein
MCAAYNLESGDLLGLRLALLGIDLDLRLRAQLAVYTNRTTELIQQLHQLFDTITWIQILIVPAVL